MKTIFIQVVFILLIYNCAIAEIGDSELLPFDVTPEMAVKAFEHHLREVNETEGPVDFENIYYYEPVLLETIDGEPAVYYIQAYWGPEPAPTFEELEYRMEEATDMAIYPMKYVNKGMTTEEVDREIEKLHFIEEDGRRYASYGMIGASIDRPLVHGYGFGFPEDKKMKTIMAPFIEKENPRFKFSRYISIINSIMICEFVNTEGVSIYNMASYGDDILSKEHLLNYTEKRRKQFEDKKVKYNRQWELILNNGKLNGNGNEGEIDEGKASRKKP